MTTSTENIRQQLTELEQQASEMAQELHRLYDKYLQVLGQAVQQQLVLVTYHVCTQMFPDRFLELSVKQREQLQRDLRLLGQETSQGLQLSHLLKKLVRVQIKIQKLEESVSADAEDALEPEVEEDMLEPEAEEEELEPEAEEEELEELDADLSVTLEEDANEESLESSPVMALSSKSFMIPPELLAQASLAGLPEFAMPEGLAVVVQDIPPMPDNPLTLMEWRRAMEGAIAEVLRSTSRKATHLLEQVKILDNPLPDTVLEAATQSDAGESISGPPNLLNLVVEIGNAEEGRKSPKPIRIVAIYLRLAEIEFADPNITLWRKKIRSLDQPIQRLNKSYHKKKQELAVAEAEAAWRSSWHND